MPVVESAARGVLGAHSVDRHGQGTHVRTHVPADHRWPRTRHEGAQASALKSLAERRAHTRRLLLVVCLLWLTTAAALEPGELAVVFSSPIRPARNSPSPMRARGIPAANLVGVDLDTSAAVLSAGRFAALAARSTSVSAIDIQALALAWTRPYRVDCMAVTSAFAFGFAERYLPRAVSPPRTALITILPHARPIPITARARPCLIAAPDLLPRAPDRARRGFRPHPTGGHGLPGGHRRSSPQPAHPALRSGARACSTRGIACASSPRRGSSGVAT